VVFVEGKGDKAAVPKLARRVVADLGAEDAIYIDPEPFVVHGLGKLVKDGCSEWLRWLQAAGLTRKKLGGVLLVLDGEPEPVPKTWSAYLTRFHTAEFCAHRVAGMLGIEARAARAGEAFSLATVFAVQEFEAWLVAGVESLRGAALAEGRGVVPATATPPSLDIETKRNAKRELRKLVPAYKQSLDQGLLAEKVDLGAVAARCRSFRRFRSAVTQLAQAVRDGKPVVTPPI
jgi:hypothetical protein